MSTPLNFLQKICLTVGMARAYRKLIKHFIFFLTNCKNIGIIFIPHFTQHDKVG